MFVVTCLKWKVIAVVATEFAHTMMRTLEYAYAYLYVSLFLFIFKVAVMSITRFLY